MASRGANCSSDLPVASGHVAAVPEQVASSSSDTGVQRPSAVCSHPGRTQSGSVSDVSQTEGVVVDVNDWDSASRDGLCALGSHGTVVTCTSGVVTMELMSKESRLSALLTAARCRDGRLEWGTIAKCARLHTSGIVGAVDHCAEFDQLPGHRARMEEKDFADKMEVYHVAPRADAAKKGCRVIRTRWVLANKGSDDQAQLCVKWE